MDWPIQRKRKPDINVFDFDGAFKWQSTDLGPTFLKVDQILRRSHLRRMEKRIGCRSLH